MYSLLFLAIGQATLVGPTEVEAYQPIVVKSEIANEDENTSATCLWRAETVKYIPVDKGRTLHVWAAPGEHTIELTTIIINWQKKEFSASQDTINIKVIGSDPPIPPIPDVKADRGVILIENFEKTQSLAMLLQKIRNSKISEKLMILDQSDPASFTKEANKYRNSKNLDLPVLLALSSEDGFVEGIELPSSFEEITSQLQKWGIN